MFDGGDPLWEEKRERTKAEAWIDIINMAAYRDHSRPVGNERVEIKRGEFLGSVRYLAHRWHWSNKKVWGFLNSMQSEKWKRIRKQRETQHGFVYLVVNYDIYNPPANNTETPKETPVDTAQETPRKHQGNTEETNINNVKEVKEVKKTNYSDEFEIAWGIYPSRGIHSNPKKPAWVRWQMRLKGGATVTQLIQAVKAYCRECHNNHLYGTTTVMMAQTFFGPNARWEEYYEKYQGNTEKENKIVEDLQPVPEMTDEDWEKQKEIIHETTQQLKERQHGESDNNSRSKG